MGQETEQINQAIQVFLESINQTNLEAIEIIFEERKIKARLICEWVWSPEQNRLVKRCRPE